MLERYVIYTSGEQESKIIDTQDDGKPYNYEDVKVIVALLNKQHATIADLQGQVKAARDHIPETSKMVGTEKCDAVRRFIHGEDKLCLVCGAKEPCELKDNPNSPCTFDPTPMELLKANHALQHRVAQLEGALERVANVPVDGDGRDYYWEGRDIAKQAIGKPTSERYTSLQADHARVLGLVQAATKLLTELTIIPIGCSREQELAWKKAVKDLRAASLPAQPAQGGA